MSLGQTMPTPVLQAFHDITPAHRKTLPGVREPIFAVAASNLVES